MDHILALAETDDRFTRVPRSLILESVRRAIDKTRTQILEDKPVIISDDAIIKQAALLAAQKMKNRLNPLINATGVVLHTNLGRALLCRDALNNIMEIASSYSNLELNLATGKRGIRYAAIEALLCELTGAQAAMAVNNNAGAVLLAS